MITLQTRDRRTFVLWVAMSLPVPLIVSAIYDSLTFSGVMWDREQTVARVAGWVSVLPLWAPPLALAVLGWMALVRRQRIFATSRAWHAVSLFCAIVVTAMLNVVCGVLFLVAVTGTTVVDEARQWLVMTTRGTHSLEWSAGAILMVLIPRVLLASRLRAAGLVDYADAARGAGP
ncbi:MAG: hypothetical protein K2R93_03835 [Gemmatimonadaceae bacterium]|nr:hypothetical protein [Gemmatimonadaceae bacterium]